jgi:hypothetical protein
VDYVLDEQFVVHPPVPCETETGVRLHRLAHVMEIWTSAASISAIARANRFRAPTTTER